MRITKQMLLDAGVAFIKEGNAYYFSVEEIRQKVPDVKIETDGIKKLSIGNAVPSRCVKPMSDWDKKIMKTLNFNPNK